MSKRKVKNVKQVPIYKREVNTHTTMLKVKNVKEIPPKNETCEKIQIVKMRKGLAM